MTKEQTAKILFSMTEGLNIKELFDTIYCDVLSINNRTRSTLYHIDPATIIPAIDIELDGEGNDTRTENYYRVLRDACEELVKYDIHDVSVYELTPIDYTDIILVRVYGKTELYKGVSARTITMIQMVSENDIMKEDDTHGEKPSMVSIMMIPEMKEIANSVSYRYYYHTIAHEIIHCILYHINYTESSFVYYKSIEDNQDVVELICDIFGFVLCDYVKEPDDYKGLSLYDAYTRMLKTCNRYYRTKDDELFKLIVDSVDVPTWITDIIGDIPLY